MSNSPIIYTDPQYDNEYLDHLAFKQNNLWIAGYGVDKPKIPDTWKGSGWLIGKEPKGGKSKEQWELGVKTFTPLQELFVVK